MNSTNTSNSKVENRSRSDNTRQLNDLSNNKNDDERRQIQQPEEIMAGSLDSGSWDGMFYL